MAPLTLSPAARSSSSIGLPRMRSSLRCVCPCTAALSVGPAHWPLRCRLRSSLSRHHACRCPCSLRRSALSCWARVRSSLRLALRPRRPFRPSCVAFFRWLLSSSSVARKPVFLVRGTLPRVVLSTGALVIVSTVRRAVVLVDSSCSPLIFPNPLFLYGGPPIGLGSPALRTRCPASLVCLCTPRGSHIPVRHTLTRLSLLAPRSPCASLGVCSSHAFLAFGETSKGPAPCPRPRMPTPPVPRRAPTALRSLSPSAPRRRLHPLPRRRLRVTAARASALSMSCGSARPAPRAPGLPPALFRAALPGCCPPGSAWGAPRRVGAAVPVG